jgi:uncharacterized protein YbcC (UPF0753/DUF2309 family)/NADH:ubiquinone oxidoreductase subunit 5 (subunit L)/multisubunit Na+/H+ antiporter MnhA subunit
MSAILVLTLLAPLLGGLSVRGRRSPLLAGRVSAVSCGLAAVGATVLLVATALEESGSLDPLVALDLRLDRLTALLLVVVLATAAMVASFSRRSLDADGRAGRYFALLGVVVTGSALVVVPGAGWLLVAGWVVSGWALVGLVGFAAPWARARAAQRRVLVSLAVGDVALAVAVIAATSTSDAVFSGDPAVAIADLQASTVAGIAVLDIVAVALVVAGAARSALFPFHRWLVGTLVAPTPVSALVHAGVVSGAGLLLIRFAPIFIVSDAAVLLAFVVGTFTIAVASTASVMRSDTKGSLAWSTVSQMAFMVVQCAVGAFSSAAFHIAGHGMYKAALFLGAGDTASAALRSRRRPRSVQTLSSTATWVIALVVPAVVVGIVTWVIPPDVSDAGQILVVVFAWVSTVFGLHGWLARGPMTAVPSVAVGTAATAVGVVAYIGGLRLVEYFVKPVLPTGTAGTIVGPEVLVATLVGVLAVVALASARGGASESVQMSWRRFVNRWTTLGLVRSTTVSSSNPLPIAATDLTRQAEIRGDASIAASIIAPQWPLASFVAVNPLGGLESLGFDEASATARRWLRGRTHLSLAEYRDDHQRGVTTTADLEYAILRRFSELSSRDTIVVAGKTVDPVHVVVADLLHGPEADTTRFARTSLERRGGDQRLADLIDEVVAGWLTEYVAAPTWPARRPGETLVAMARRLAPGDPHLNRLLAGHARQWISEIGDDPAAVIDAAFAVAGVGDDTRVDEMRGHLSRLAGWAGLAKWRKEWAANDDPHPVVAPIEIVAVRSMLEAVVIASLAPDSASREPEPDSDPEALALRSAAVAQALAGQASDDDRAAVAEVLADIPASARASLWLAAQEHHIDDGLLSLLDRVDPGATLARPDAQIVFCIDVRSEGLRRHLETGGNIETFGFAGFFGVAMRVRRLGWEKPEARCPVLVAPAISAAEDVRRDAVGTVAAELARQRALEAVHHAHDEAKHGPGAPFVLAETAGWAVGPAAMARTWIPATARPVPVPSTTLRLDEDVLVEQRIFLAESVLNTMGLIDRFAPLVVLCGHTSTTVNNPHATALECGACGGAAGDSNARAVAALLNSPEIRMHLVERGITIPEDTWFLAGVHDTVSDHVTLLDAQDAPAELQPIIDDLRTQLAGAGHQQSGVRARHLPGPAQRVRHRGADWAQVRPEWGLARNAAFIVGPRSMTAGLDLDGRAFLHTYDADLDPSGRVLETIMTAPLVVAHWISSQYYFSTVDPEVFGAGDKLLHNPIGATGVISGDSGDLRVGLPLQSTHLDGQRHHQPVRLLAVIQADIVRIERIISANPILQTLTEGSWLRIAGRSRPHEPWSTRTPSGTWTTIARPLDESAALVDHLIRGNA